MNDTQSAEFLASMAKLGDLKRLLPENTAYVFGATNFRFKAFNLHDEPFPQVSKETISAARQMLKDDPDFGDPSMSDEALDAEIKRRNETMSEADEALVSRALSSVDSRGKHVRVAFSALDETAAAVHPKDVASTPTPKLRHQRAYRKAYQSKSVDENEAPDKGVPANEQTVETLVRMRRKGEINRLTSTSKVAAKSEVAARFYHDPSLRLTVTQADLEAADKLFPRQTAKERQVEYNAMSPADIRTSRLMAEKFLSGDIKSLSARAAWTALAEERMKGPSEVSIPRSKHFDMAASTVVERTSILAPFSKMDDSSKLSAITVHGSLRGLPHMKRAETGVRSLFTDAGAKALEDSIANPPTVNDGVHASFKAAAAMTFRDTGTLSADDPTRRKSADLAAMRGLSLRDYAAADSIVDMQIYSSKMTRALMSRAHTLEAIEHMAQDPAREDMHSLPKALKSLTGKEPDHDTQSTERGMREGVRAALRGADASTPLDALVAAAVAVRHSELQEVRARQTALKGAEGEKA